MAVPAERIRLVDIVGALGESTERDQCLLRSKGCSEEKPCILHSRLAGLRRQLDEMLETTSVADLISGPAPGGEAPEKESEPA